jgi:predicted TIM-barrel fold metal-dependent hydrolase
MFAADHPFEDVADGTEWFDALALEPDVRERIACGNASRLLRLA